jgi:MYXO-CTERM domain-containing protein
MRIAMLFLAAVVLAPAAEAVAQSNDTGEVDVNRQNDDGNSKIGLLGLLGLAGLLGLRRREPDIHVDARQNKER